MQDQHKGGKIYLFLVADDLVHGHLASCAWAEHRGTENMWLGRILSQNRQKREQEEGAGDQIACYQ